MPTVFVALNNFFYKEINVYISNVNNIITQLCDHCLKWGSPTWTNIYVHLLYSSSQFPHHVHFMHAQLY